MNEHIIQLLQNEDDNNRLLGIHLAVGDGWSVEDIFKWLLVSDRSILYIEYNVKNYSLDYFNDNNVCRIWHKQSKAGEWIKIKQDTSDKLKEYQAKFIELLLN